MADARDAPASQDSYPIALAKVFVGSLRHRDQASGIEPHGDFVTISSRDGFFCRRAA
jgi:hypothetical protein